MTAELTAQQRAEGTPLITAARGFGRFLLWLAARPTVVGLENVPETGKVLLAANHTHNFDGPTLFSVIPRPAGFFVKAEAFVGPIGPFLRRIGQIPIKRGVPQREPIATALGSLAAGGLVGIFPEGSRGAGDVAEVRHGIAYLAVRSGAPVVPVAFVGSRAMLPRRSIRRPKIRIVIGEPVHIAAGPASRSAVSDAAEKIRVALSALVTSAGAEQ